MAVAAVLRKWFYFMGLCCFLRSATGGRFVLCPAVLQRQSFESISKTSRAAGGSRRPGVNFDTSDVGGRLGSATRAVRHCGRPPRPRGLRQGSLCRPTTQHPGLKPPSIRKCVGTNRPSCDFFSPTCTPHAPWSVTGGEQHAPPRGLTSSLPYSIGRRRRVVVPCAEVSRHLCCFPKEMCPMVRFVCFLVFLYGLFNLFELVRSH